MTRPDTNTIEEGDIVSYWRGAKEGKPDGTGKVYAVGDMGGSDVVWINGCRGCIALSHVERVQP